MGGGNECSAKQAKLHDLPLELLTSIVRFLARSDVASIAATTIAFRPFARECWAMLLSTHYGSVPTTLPTTTACCAYTLLAAHRYTLLASTNIIIVQSSYN
jgi:hypothetical protein